MLNEALIRQRIADKYEFPPLEFRLYEEGLASRNDASFDTLVETTWEGNTYQFEAEIKAQSNPRNFENALVQIDKRSKSKESRRPPLLIMPYLKEAQLNELQQRQISGIDLSGNGVIIVPGKLFVYRTGKPNKFPDSAPSKYAYRGATSLVARVLLCRPRYASQTEIMQEIKERGGNIVPSTISKAVKRLESDVIIDRTTDGFILRQPDKLLEFLAGSFRPPQVTSTVTLSCTAPLADLFASIPGETHTTLTGKSSIAAYAVMGRQEWPVLYTESIASLRRAWGDSVQETQRFIDLELRQTDDETVYFDSRVKAGLTYASPVQVYLECSAGDKREQEIALDVQTLILRELQSKRGG